jgi:Na+/pantothenate symporter
LGGHVLIEKGVIESATDKNLIPQLINLLSDSAPWLVGLLAVCALAAMQSTGAAYMSTFSAMVTRDIYAKFISTNSSDENQKNYKIIFKFVVIDKYDQVYVFPVSEETLVRWMTSLREALQEANYHYSERKYDLPYVFATGSVTL